MPDLGSVVRQMEATGTFNRLGANLAAQFGTQSKRYIGAELLPERLVPQNEYTEERIKYRSVIANAGTRYSPTQKKGGALVGSFGVKLAESDIANELTGREYDVLLDLLQRNATMEATSAIIGFVNKTINIPLVEWCERARWQAIVNALVLLRGDNEYAEDVAYSAPAGHRVVAATAWSNNTYDPYTDIFAGAAMLSSKGYAVKRIISTNKVVGIMGNNTLVKGRTGRITVVGGTITNVQGRVTLNEINAALSSDDLPAIEKYDLQYQTSTGTGRFIPDNCLVMIGSTDNSEGIPLSPDVFETLENTLGYVGIGRAAGQSAPGRRIRSEHFENKPPRIEAEGWQTALPVITEPEAIYVITGIA
jgi:hypothetical protein